MMYYTCSLLVGMATLSLVDGHGYMKSPRSRNYYAYDVISKPEECSSGCPPAEYCPHCLNRNDGVCGKSPSYSYETVNWKTPWRSQSGNEEYYVEGGTITIKSYLDTHHNGHMEARVCLVTGASSCTTPEEFAGNELIFESDLALGGHIPMPKDPYYPERGMFAGGQGGTIKEFAFKYRLPIGIYGEKVLLQWKYITANSCSPPGYTAYFTNNSNLPGSYWTTGLSTCTVPYPNDGLSWPEQFFNCAEITVRSGGPTVPPNPMPTTKKPNTQKPTTKKPNNTKPNTTKPTTPKPVAKPSKPTTSKPVTAKPVAMKPATSKPSIVSTKTSLKPITNSCCASRNDGYQSCYSDAWCNMNAAQCATCAGLFTSVPIARTGCCTWGGGGSCQIVNPATNPGCHYRQADCEGDCRGTWQPIV